MKRIILTFLVIIFTVSIYAQELAPDTSKKEFRNVIGLNITNLLFQNGYINTYDYYPYPYYYLSSPYMIIYKRIYRKSAIRLGIGWILSNYNNKNNDTLKSNSNNNTLNIGLGYERYGFISKRWTYFYGADAIGSYSHVKSHEYYSYRSNYDNNSTTFKYGISPLFGLMFRFNNRISISTETCYDLTYSQSKTDSYSSSSTTPYSHSISSGLQTAYHAPATIMVRIQF